MDPIILTTMSIQFDTQRLNTIANNAANVMTPGYKRELLANIGHFDSLLSQQSTQPTLSAIVDTKPGIQMLTGNPLDLALLNEGYFEVMSDYGRAYTRQGSFKLDEKGKLVSQTGHAVSGTSGDIYLSGSNPSVDKEGNVFDDGELVAQLKVVSFGRDQSLVKLGGGLFIPTSQSTNVETIIPRVSQGHLESSNVDSAQEMIKLVETFRHFETSHKVLQAYDELNDKALKNLSQF